MRVLNGCRSILSRLDGLLFKISGAILLLMIAHIMAEAVLRFTGVRSNLQTLILVAAWYMVAVVFFAMPRTARTAGHITVDLVTRLMPARMRMISETAMRIVSAGYVLLLCVLTYSEAVVRTQGGETWESATGYITVWPSRWVLPLSFALMALVYLLWPRGGEARETPKQNPHG